MQTFRISSRIKIKDCILNKEVFIMLKQQDDYYDLNERNFNPMNDVIFKFIFGKEERKHITIDFLNAMLQDDLGHPIADIVFAPSEMTPANNNDKLTRLDVACTLDSGEQVDVEVQVVNYKDMQRRTLYYWSQLYLSGLGTGQDYIELKPVITINILNFRLFTASEAHSMWSIYNAKTGQRLNKDLTLHFLEVPKFATIAHKPVKEMTTMERWLAYFANKLDKIGREELIMSETAIHDAVDAAKVFFQNKAERLQYINREMAIMDYNANMRGSKEEGKKEGIILGREQGREQEKVASALRMLKNGTLSLNQIATFSDLPLQKVQELA